MRVCATPPLQERYRHVQRRAAVARRSYESDFPALTAAWTCNALLHRRSEAMRSARAVRRPAEVGAFAVHLRCPAKSSAFGAHFCSTVYCSPCAPTPGEKGRKKTPLRGSCPAFPALRPPVRLCYSSTPRHSKRVDARFAKRTVYRPPSGELVMVLIR